jgi:hypothetical protein
MASLKFNSPEIRIGLDSAKASPLIKTKNSSNVPKDKKRIVKPKTKKYGK